MGYLSPEEYRKFKEENTIRVPYRGWGSPTVRVWIAGKDVFEQILPEGFVVWKMECVSDSMWAPGIYEVYQLYLEEPDRYDGQEEAKSDGYRSCKLEYVAIRRETPEPEPETFEKLLADFGPHLSRKRYQELLQELEGKTSEEKEQILREEMEELMAVMSYY